MILIDLDAPIKPGKSSAGICLGMALAEFESSIDPYAVKTWSRQDGEQLAVSINRCNSWLRVSVSEIRENSDAGEIWYKNRGNIQLSFGQSGCLFDISVFENYGGLVFGSIRVGMPLSVLEKIGKIDFDRAEEMYFFEDSVGISGVGFYADFAVVVPCIHGISVFDLKYF